MHLVIAAVTTVTLISGAISHNVSTAHHAPKPRLSSAPQTKIDRPPGAYILVDNDTGNVLQSNNEHVPMPPASTTKLLTALVSISSLPANSDVTIRPDVENVPALKIGLKAGEVWNLNDLLHATLLVSANDAALTLADATSGSIPAFAVARSRAAETLGLTDSPVFNNPAGLDDSTNSPGGGDLVSAHDMAIIGRAALASPVIRSIVAEKRYDFVESDGSHHHMLNHNQLINTYAGAIGVKTGYTEKARHTLVAAATRDGRTMLAVVLDADDPDATAKQLMDQGFATPVDQEPSTEHLALAQLPPYQATTKPAAHLAIAASRKPANDTIVLSIAGFGAVALAAFTFIFGRRRKAMP